MYGTPFSYMMSSIGKNQVQFLTPPLSSVFQENYFVPYDENLQTISNIVYQR